MFHASVPRSSAGIGGGGREWKHNPEERAAAAALFGHGPAAESVNDAATYGETEPGAG